MSVHKDDCPICWVNDNGWNCANCGGPLEKIRVGFEDAVTDDGKERSLTRRDISGNVTALYCIPCAESSKWEFSKLKNGAITQVPTPTHTGAWEHARETNGFQWYINSAEYFGDYRKAFFYQTMLDVCGEELSMEVMRRYAEENDARTPPDLELDG